MSRRTRTEYHYLCKLLSSLFMFNSCFVLYYLGSMEKVLLFATEIFLANFRFTLAGIKVLQLSYVYKLHPSVHTMPTSKPSILQSLDVLCKSRISLAE